VLQVLFFVFMNIFDKTLNAIGLVRKAATLALASAVADVDPFLLWSQSRKVTIERSLNMNIGWVYTCVRAISEEIAKQRFRLFQVNKDGTNEEIFDHEILDLLEGVNPYQTAYDLKYLTTSYLELAGNSYWLLDGVKNETSKPTAIYLLNPKNTAPIPAKLPEFIKGYKYSINGETQTFQPYEIMHFKYPDPNDPYQGIGTVQAIMDWIQTDNFANDVNLNYFKNGARLGGILSSDNAITDAQMKVMRASFENLYKGAGNAYRVAVLPKGVKYDEASSTPKDMDFANMQTVMRDKILSGFRVPKTILGSSESETNRATAETANYVFASRTIKPKMELIVQQLNEFLVPRFGDNLYLDFADPVPEDRQLRIQEMQAAMGQQPVISVNEAREEYFGLDGVDGGDDVMKDFNKEPVGSPTVTAPAKQAKKDGKKPSTRFAKNHKARKGIAEEIAKRLTESIETENKKMDEVKSKGLAKGIAHLSHEDYGMFYKAFALRVTPYEKLQTERVRKFNADQRKEVIKNVTRLLKSNKAIAESDIFNKTEWLSIMINLSTPVLSDLYQKEGAEAGAMVGFNNFRLTPTAKDSLDHSISLMSDSYNSTTLSLLKDSLTQGQVEGWSLAELTDSINSVYDYSDEVRAGQVARTETFRVANDSTKEAWKQSGVVKSIKWYTAEDDEVCEWCEPMDGTVIDINDNFFNQGDSATGTDGSTLSLNYDDVGSPPLHVNCRCYTQPEDISIE
jgi:HK97 family phage portal protein